MKLKTFVFIVGLMALTPNGSLAKYNDYGKEIPAKEKGGKKEPFAKIDVIVDRKNWYAIGEEAKKDQDILKRLGSIR
jgi:hypothetical protein